MNILADLFVTFAKVGAMTFGGGYAMLPILQREGVDNKGWATEEELMDYYKGMLKLRSQFRVYAMRDKRALEKIKFYDKNGKMIDPYTKDAEGNVSADGNDMVVFSVDAWDRMEPWKRLWVIYAARKQVDEAEIVTAVLPKAKRLRVSDGISVLDIPEPVSQDTAVVVMAGGVSVFVEPWD